MDDPKREARGSDDWAALLAAANRGDAAAYARFLRAVTPVLRRIVRARGGSLSDADGEDVVQDVLMALHLKRHTWREGEPARPWVYAIARYKIVDAFRARGMRITVPIDDIAETHADPGVTDPTRAGDLARMIGMLDPRAAEIVRRIGIEGESAAEAGAGLGMTEGAVRVALHRALKRLAELRERHVS